MSILVIVCVFVTVTLFVLSIFPARDDLLQERLKMYGDRVPHKINRASTSSPFTTRVVNPILRKLSAFVAQVAPANMRRVAQRDLRLAASGMSANTFLTIQIGAIALLPVAYALPLVLQQRPWTMTNSIVVAVLALFGWRIPRSWLVLRADARRTQIERALPDALDLIVVSMEAGLSFDAGLSKVIEKTSGPLRDELARVLQDISLGKMRREALRELGRRCGVPDLISFCNAMAQADQMGLSSGQVLRTQADDARLRRRQRAEETAMKAPVKMLFPLLFCILPAMMLVVVGPAAVSLYTNLLPALGR